MASISSPGIGSQLDVNSIVSQLMTIERQPLATLDRKEAVYQSQLSAFGLLKSAVAGYQDAMRNLSSLSKFQALKAGSSDESVFTTSLSPTAVAGSYSVEVKQLAASQKLSSAAFSSTSDTIGTGVLTFQFGSDNAGVFTPDSAKPALSVTIGAANSTLNGVRDAINAAKIGVSASILNDGTGNKLIITSNDTGAANSLKISVSDTSDASDIDNLGLSRLAYDPAAPAGSGRNLTQNVAAQNAILKVDGIDGISKSTNSVNDVVQGVTLNLLKKSAVDTPAILTVSTDTSTIKASLENFVKAYNELNNTVKDLTAYDANTRKAAVLQGDSSALAIISQVRRTLNDSLTGVSGQFSRLSQVGISFQKDGALSLDSAKLQTALDSSLNDIAGLFANVGKSSDSLVRYVSASDKAVAGKYALNISQLASQGGLDGAATAALAHTAGTFTSPFVVDGDNDTFSIKVDGIQSATITLSQNSYTTAAALTAEIQSRLNGDSALKAAGVTATVSFDSSNNKLVITSDRYGSASRVEITGVDTNTAATLGISVAAGTTGVDVAGTLNGITATGSGRFLTGAGGAVEGLKLEITGGLTGDRGTIDYSLGYAYRLDKLAGQLLGNSGPISSRSSGINNSIDAIDQRRDVLNRQIAAAETRYRAQFSALDSLMAQLRSTSDYLTSQLAALPGAAKR